MSCLLVWQFYSLRNNIPNPSQLLFPILDFYNKLVANGNSYWESLMVKSCCTECFTFLALKINYILVYTCLGLGDTETSARRQLSSHVSVESPATGKCAHLDPRKYPLEIFFIHGHFSADLKIWFIHGNEWFNITRKQQSQLSQHNLFILFFVFQWKSLSSLEQKNLSARSNGTGFPVNTVFKATWYRLLFSIPFSQNSELHTIPSPNL